MRPLFSLLILLILLIPLSPTHGQDAPEWWRDAVFYEIFVRSFYDSDGDGIGDLNGITARLDYLNDGDPATTTDLGIDAIWLMPIMPSPSYHGYDVTDYRAIHPDYGTLEDFDRLLAEAHARGIRIIIDLVINHSSTQHPWFQASQRGDPEFADWYIWRDADPGWRGPDNQQVWHPANGRFYYALFWGGMPDFNHENPRVTAEMIDIARFWLERGVDGFRLDAVKHIIEEGQNQENTPATIAWMTTFRDAIKAIRPDALVLGEIWSTTYAITPYIRAGAVDLAFEFDLASAMLESASSGRAAAVASLQQRAVTEYRDAVFAAFLSNHDQNRVASVLRDPAAVRAAAHLLLTSPGVPFIYYGEEIGMVGVKPDERLRTPMQWTDDPRTAGFSTRRPWQPLQSGTATANVAVQTDDPTSLLSTYRDLIRLRRDLGLAGGTIAEVRSASRAVYAFLHTNPAGESTLIVINLSASPVSSYALSFRGNLAGRDRAEARYGAETVAQPILNEMGRFADYLPVPELPPYGLLAIRLS
jgi:glycosidase